MIVNESSQVLKDRGVYDNSKNDLNDQNNVNNQEDFQHKCPKL